MGTRMVRLTVLFEPPFWIGLCEREEDGQYAVCRIVFGAEPREQEVYAFVLATGTGCASARRWRRDDSRAAPQSQARSEIRRALTPAGIGTKAQQALGLQREQGKAARRVQTRAEREREQARQFQLRQTKRKEKHRGH
ncbi:MAG: YjdF family protein [Oscillospiraceae bacterium]